MTEPAYKIGDKISGYCMKEKMKVEFTIDEINPTKAGTHVNKGKCPNCGTVVCAFSK